MVCDVIILYYPTEDGIEASVIFSKSYGFSDDKRTHSSRIQNPIADTLALGRIGSGTKLACQAGSLRTGHAPTVGLWGPVSSRNAGFQNVDRSRRTHTFTSAHSEWNAAEIHCLRRPSGRDENRSFVNIPAARSKLAVSSAEWFRQAIKICVRRLLPIV